VDGVVASRDPHFFPEHDLPHHRPAHLLLFECEEPDHVETLDRSHLENKVAALLAHESQFESTMVIGDQDDGSQTEAFVLRISHEAAKHGALANVALGEAFKLAPGL
jgi:hypothetical protein